MAGRRLAVSVVLLGMVVVGSVGRPGWAPARPYSPAPRAAPRPAAVVPAEAAYLVDLAAYSPDLALDIRYATDNNFVGRPMYPMARALLTQGTAAKLERARLELLNHGYQLVVWDAYRPYSVQLVMWSAWPDARHVADPGTHGSAHNRAAAVDVTLRCVSGAAAEMPTAFDHFGPEADINWPGHSHAVRQRALLLRNVMIRAGFRPYDAEWWHFNDSEWREYPLLDLPVDVAVPPP